MTSNSEARKRREEAEQEIAEVFRGPFVLTNGFLIKAANDALLKRDVAVAENARLRARIAELESRCHITTDAAGHLSCQTCRRSAEA